jgi:FkbM family methyltransferase
MYLRSIQRDYQSRKARFILQCRILNLLKLRFFVKSIKARHHSNSQLFQELFVLAILGFKRNGIFIEVGGTDGKLLSNSSYLEKLGWKGIIIEPARVWHTDLRKNRSCILDFRAASNESGLQVSFSETAKPELSTITSMKPNDYWAQDRLDSIDYQIETVTINDVLTENGLPTSLDYLSIDTEGSEYDVLRGCNLAKYSFQVITIEHADNQIKRASINRYLRNLGYRRVLEGYTLWEDWYVNTEN